MNSHKKTARIVGLLFIIATVSSILATFGFLEPLLNTPDYLLDISENSTRLIVGVLIDAMNSAAVVAIAVMLFPILKKHHEALAMGYVASRILESMILVVGHISQLALVQLSREYVRTGSQDASYFLPSGTLLQAASAWTFLLGPMIVLSLTALILNQILYQSRLVPRFISVWGLIGAVSMFAAGLSGMFGLSPISTLMILLGLPLALNEMVLAVWLIVKGFNPSAIDSEFVQQT